jgi:hypothetical protein
MKNPTVEEAAKFMGLEKKGRYYYDHLYIDGYMAILPFGQEPVYISDDVFADSNGYTGKQVLKLYHEYIAENPEETL